MPPPGRRPEGNRGTPFRARDKNPAGGTTPRPQGRPRGEGMKRLIGVVPLLALAGGCPAPPGIAPPGMNVPPMGMMPGMPGALPGAPGGPPAGIPGAVAAVGALTGGTAAPFGAQRTEIRFVDPKGMKLSWFAPK